MTQSYSSYDLVWHSTVDRDGIPHPLKIRFGMGIELSGKEERYLSRLPQISHVLRNQIIFWVNDPTLKAKARGLIVLTTTYLPDIRVPEPIQISEEKSVDLVVARPHDPHPVDSSCLPHNAANSLAIGFLERKDTIKAGMRELMHGIVLKSFRQKSKKPVLIDLPLHEYVARGWDETNKQWRNTVWPTLDEEFRDVPISAAAWNLRIQAGSSRVEAVTEGAGVLTRSSRNVVATMPPALLMAESSQTEPISTATSRSEGCDVQESDGAMEVD
ncbi:hypothetical protein FB45DRAFT_1079899 [Roridomyces roridus]|uniref:Uncharacterized protein n=1 Tax=Roridomyces roridus TaxID=1738132 RepID=A0AAD7BRS0_9AGAR|nr:hypothetical protein FB45DRAFT_1079899 [Roridomyces roridus]